MGQTAIYQCQVCDNNFTSSEGGGEDFEDMRCFKCDHLQRVPRGSRPYPGVKIWRFFTRKRTDQPDVPPPDCPTCHLPLRHDLRPMCPKCKNRNFITLQVLRYYD